MKERRGEAVRSVRVRRLNCIVLWCSDVETRLDEEGERRRRLLAALEDFGRREQWKLIAKALGRIKHLSNALRAQRS